MLFTHIIVPMSKTITKKRSKQKEVDPKFGVSEWDPAELDVRQTRHGTYESKHLLEEGLGEIKLRKKHINLGKDKGKQIPLSSYLLIPLQIPWIQMRPKKSINK